MPRALAVLALLLAPALSGLAAAQGPAEFTITPQVLRPAAQVPPLGANNWGRCGAVEWAANNFVHNPGNEPVHWRNLHRAVNVGPNWFEIDGPGTSWWDLWGNGFLSGADGGGAGCHGCGDRQGEHKAEDGRVCASTRFSGGGCLNHPGPRLGSSMATA